MRTTIEIKPRTGRRWAKGFSTLIAEALDAYLTWADAEEAKHRAALNLRGALGPTQAEALATATRGVREACRLSVADTDRRHPEPAPLRADQRAAHRRGRQRMTRRYGPLVTILTSVLLLVGPPPAGAEDPPRSAHLGILWPEAPPAASSGAPDARSRALVEALEAAGHVEGGNLKLTTRWGDDRAERLPALAGELVQARVDVLVAVTGPAVQAARQATSTIPIVGIVGADPAETRLLADLARPGGNVTGVTRQASPSTPVLFALLREVVPRASSLAVLRHTPIPSPMATAWRETQLTARALRVVLRAVDVRGPGELEATFEALVRQKTAALIVSQHPEFLAHRARIVELAAASRLPTGYELREFVEAGGLLSYGPGAADLFRRAAAQVDKLLRGTRPAELPIGAPTGSELVVNLTTAKALGLTIPPALLLRADQTIE